jgi:hypothetical protein
MGNFFPVMQPTCGELIVEEGAGVEQRNAERLDLLGDGAEDGFGVAAFQREENLGGLEVGMKSLEQSPRCDLAGHQGVARVELPERLEHFPSWPTSSKRRSVAGNDANEIRAASPRRTR